MADEKAECANPTTGEIDAPTNRWDYDGHPGDCCPRVIGDLHTVHCRECAGTGVWPVPWIGSPAEGIGREDSTCVQCKASGRMEVALAAPRLPPGGGDRG